MCQLGTFGMQQQLYIKSANLADLTAVLDSPVKFPTVGNLTGYAGGVMDNELSGLLKIAATFVGTVGGMQLIAMRGKKIRRDEIADFEQRLRSVEESLRKLEAADEKQVALINEYARKIDTVVAQVGDMRDLLQKLLDIQLEKR